ncbi:hypothetical protein EZ449_21405 [Pedobacter frigidisoli]|uniref:Uncharacterized protein n=1 Tax=Pedobacter frigidisoli TaxID=2530455 RepID=A0A4V2MKQ3_9SPHI|nr:hypothetical protein [Pedobacter frigidisoli]TCC99086.1 hypothetical protein EZ449_21405 [Pedobacter frigidisoli]
MKLSDSQRKWGKRILIFVCFWVILGFALTVLVDYRLKEIIQLAVKEKSNDQYVFEAGGASFSLLKKNIIIRNATIFKKDSVNTAAHYQIKVARLYFGITSFRQLIFHQKLILDSLSLSDPLISLHEHSKAVATQKKQFHTENIESLIKKALVHLQVKSFHIKNATYVFKSKVNPTELRINQINFTVKNFSDAENVGKHLFSTEDIDLSIGKQEINFPDGLHRINFKNLHFSGKNQFFELDNFGFLAKATSLRTETKITADKFRFKSSALASIFTKDELILDTVLLLKPVLSIW